MKRTTTEEREATAAVAAPVAPAGMTLVVYTGPHPQVTLKGVPELGELVLDRGKPVELPAAIAADLAKRKKVSLVKATAATTADEQA